MKALIFMVLITGLLSVWSAQAKEYEIFDGRHYNGKYYPRVDVIEWGTPAHLEFHIYSKEKPVDIATKVEVKNGKRILLVSYLLTDRNERLCRRVLAPASFKPDAKLYYYRDKSDSDYENIFVSATPMPISKTMRKYPAGTFKECDATTVVANNPNAGGGRGLASDTPAEEPIAEPDNDTSVYWKKKNNYKHPDKLIDYEQSAVPFSF